MWTEEEFGCGERVRFSVTAEASCSLELWGTATELLEREREITIHTV